MSTIESGLTMHIYRVSKTQAERAGWKFVEERKPEWDLVTMNPPIVIGPWLPGYARENDSSMLVAEYLTGEKKVAPDGGMGFVDVRDVARAHVLAMQTPRAKGRYLIAAGSLLFIDMCRMLKEFYPGRPIPLEKAPGSALKPEYDCSKAKDDLGWEGRDVGESLKAQCDACIAAGKIN